MQPPCQPTYFLIKTRLLLLIGKAQQDFLRVRHVPAGEGVH